MLLSGFSKVSLLLAVSLGIPLGRVVKIIEMRSHCGGYWGGRLGLSPPSSVS
jgi:hypothetical protein